MPGKLLYRMNVMDRKLISLSLGSLFVGTLVYLLDRPPGNLALLPSNISLYAATPQIFGIMGQWLPSFVHVFSLILLTVGVAGLRNAASIVTCLSWFLVDAAFELSQHPALSQFATNAVLEINMSTQVSDHFVSYLQSGIFDIFDLAAICLGAATAFCVIHVSALEER